MPDTPARTEADNSRSRAGLLDSILQQIPHGISVYGPDRRLTMVNDAYNRIMTGAPASIGDTLEQVVRRRVESGEFGDGDPTVLIETQLAHNIALPQMRRRRRPDGRTIDIRTAPLPDGGHISVVTDVTSLMEAQAELEAKANLMASIISHIPHGVSVYGPDHALRLVNPAYNDIMQGAPIALGETVEQIIDKRARAGEYGPGPPDEVARRQRAHDNTRLQRRRRRRPTGATIDIRTAPLPDGGHISVVTDVTPLITAEAELARRAESMDAMLANIRHGIVLWDENRRIIAVNPVVTDLLGAGPDVFVPGRSLESTVANWLERGNLGEGATARDRANWLTTDRRQSHTDQRQTPDGRVLEVRSDPTPSGGFVTTYTDVTQIREAEDALRLAKSAAEAANAAKSRFLASMSAELRTPLNKILGELAALDREATPRPGALADNAQATAGIDQNRLRKSCEAASTAARRLLGLIDTILDVARLDAGRFDLADDTVDLSQLIRACLRVSDSAAAAAEVALVVDLPENLPPVRCDERRMRQALTHLVSNAVKFAGPAGSVSISARQEWTSGDLLLRVQDTGPGIPQAHIEHLFVPFTQLNPATDERRPQGAGLGLYISRTLLRAHGGDLLLRSIEGQGTTAVLRIPASRVLQDDHRDLI